MKKIALVISIILFVCNCKEAPVNLFQLEGDINNLPSDTILIYNMEPDSTAIDTLFVVNGKFRFQVQTDTTATYMLLFRNMERLPIYADKNLKVHITGDSTNYAGLHVAGGTLNEELNAFRQQIAEVQDSDSITLLADSFVRNNPYSRVSIYVLNRYFLAKKQIDYKQVEELISSMSGMLQDTPEMKEVAERLKKQESSAIGRRAPSFSLKNRENEVVTNNNKNFKDKYLLINFWATWADQSKENNAIMKRFKKKYKKNELDFLGISFDMNKKQWEQTIKDDTLKWEQLIDPEGWESPLITSYALDKLPEFILLNPRKNIIARGIGEKELTIKLDSIFKVHPKPKKKKP